MQLNHSNGSLQPLRLPGGDLFDYIVKNGPLSELEAKFAIYQVLQALQVRRDEICPLIENQGCKACLTGHSIKHQ